LLRLITIADLEISLAATAKAGRKDPLSPANDKESVERTRSRGDGL
jgi:hypothetical protein